MRSKEITVIFLGRRFPRDDWRYEIDQTLLTDLFAGLTAEYRRFDIGIKWAEEPEQIIEVRGYGDLLNSVRLRSPADGVGNLCLGHIIGTSANCDLLEDIRRGVSRIAFAPETIAPEEHNRRICHNCGCGC